MKILDYLSLDLVSSRLKNTLKIWSRETRFEERRDLVFMSNMEKGGLKSKLLFNYELILK